MKTLALKSGAFEYDLFEVNNNGKHYRLTGSSFTYEQIRTVAVVDGLWLSFDGSYWWITI